jgi:HAD superfamily hydrolase (TIGR01549 family)
MITAGADITSVYHAATTLRFYNGHVRTRHTPTVVLLDLDDTLFDHELSARQALRHVHDASAAFAEWPFDAFEAAHAAVLEELHLDVLAGRRTVDQAREERFRRLLAEAGASAGEGVVQRTAVSYRQAYQAARRPVSGAVELLAAIKPRARIGIVSNNILEEQQGKIALCGFESYIDVLAVSEAVGAAKPDPAIFEYALRELSVPASEAVMIGDSWIADIAGALAAGIRPIWFNRSNRPAPAGTPGVSQIASLTPAAAVLDVIFDTNTPSDIEADVRCASA